MNLYFTQSPNRFSLLLLTIPIILIFSVFKTTHTQKLESTVISSVGNANTDPNIALTYTIEEYTSAAKIIGNAIVIQDFEQPKLENLIVSVFEDNLNLPLKIYPNPPNYRPI